MSVGYIYVMTNAAMPGLAKIGLTHHDVSRRARELASTGVPAPFVVEYYCLTSDCEAVERLAHSHFAKFRAPGREFFRVEPAEAVLVIDSIVRPVQPDRFCRFTLVRQETGLQTDGGSLKLPAGVRRLRGARFYRGVIRHFEASGEGSATLRIGGLAGQELLEGLRTASQRTGADGIELRCLMGNFVGLYKRGSFATQVAGSSDSVAAPPDWYADPTGRHEHRYWDGAVWTAAVSDRGVRLDDPLEVHPMGGV